MEKVILAVLKINIKELKGKSVFSYCRQLIEQGLDPTTRLEIYRNLEDWDFAVTSIGKGAKLTLVDGDRDGLVIKQYVKVQCKPRTCVIF